MTTLKVQKRDMGTKAKRLRREGYVTGNLFGKDMEGSVPLQIEKKEAERIQRECLKGSRLVLDLDGKKYNVLLKELDYDTMKRQILEMDFQALVSGEKIHSVAEIIFHNKEMVVDGVLEELLTEIEYKAVPEALVERVDIDCSKLKVGDSLTVGDLEIAKDKDIEIVTHLDTPVVNVVASHNAVADEEEAEFARLLGEYIGICFQIKDDIFDYFNSKEIGKPTGNDMLEGKLTLPALYVLNNTKDDTAREIAIKVKDGTATPDEIARLIAFIKENGGIEYAIQTMNLYKEKALGLLASLPDSDVCTALRAYLNYVVDREK